MREDGTETALDREDEAVAPRRAPWAAVMGLAGGLVVGAIAGGLLAGPLLVERLAAAESAVAEASDAGPPSLFLVENLVVNPAGSQGLRFLVATLAVEVDSPEAVEALGAREAEARDALLRVLGNRTVRELADVDGRAALKAELRETVAALLTEGEVERVYLPQFVIQ